MTCHHLTKSIQDLSSLAYDKNPTKNLALRIKDQGAIALEIKVI